MGWRDLAVAAAVFAGYVGLAAWLPPVDDELYYWCWSRELQWSYYDHPAMTAVWIRASTELFGDTILAIRLPACAAMAGVFLLLRSLVRPKSVLFAALVTPPFTLGAVLITPDTPLLLFWAAYLRWLVGAHRSLVKTQTSPPPPPLHEWRGGARITLSIHGEGGERSSPGEVFGFRWLLGGILLGCGVLGKYTMGLAGVCGLVSFVLLGRSRGREWLPGFFLHGVVSLLVASPILIFNLEHDFAPLRYQWDHAMSDDVPGVGPLAEFVGVQILLVGTLPLVLLPWVFRHWKELTADPRLRVCVCLFALPLVFFLFKATRGRLEGNWALAAYLGFWPLAGVWWQRCAASPVWKWLTRLAFALPALCVAVAVVHLLYPLPFWPVKHDRIRRLSERQEQCRRVRAAVAARPLPGPVYVPTYQLTAHLRFHGIDARQLAGVSRPSHFTQTPDSPDAHPVWFWFGEFPLPEEFARRFPPPVELGDIPLTVRGERYVEYTLWEYRSPPP